MAILLRHRRRSVSNVIDPHDLRVFRALRHIPLRELRHLFFKASNSPELLAAQITGMGWFAANAETERLRQGFKYLVEVLEEIDAAP